MKLKPRLLKLNRRGIVHHLIPLVAIVLFAIVGTAYIVASHAAEAPAYLGINGANCTISGWASEDLASSSEVITVDVYANGPPGNPANPGSGAFIGEVTNGGHGYPATNPNWSLAIPPGYQNKPTTFYVYATNQGGTVTGPAGGGFTNQVGTIYGSDPVVSTPNVSCPGAPPPVSNNEPPPDLAINTADCTNGLSGWASEGLASSPEIITIDVYANGPWAINGGGTYIGQVNNGGHGYPGPNPSWYMPIPVAYQNVATKFYVYAVNQGGTVTGPAGGVFSSAVGPIYGADPITSIACQGSIGTGGGSGGGGGIGSGGGGTTNTPPATGGTHSLIVAPPPNSPIKPVASAASSLTGAPVYSPNWTGYYATPPGKAAFTEVKGQIKVPAFTCPAATAWTSIWVGFDGYTNNAVEQDGISAYCKTAGAAPLYNTWWEMWPTNSMQYMPVSIAPGDTVGMDVQFSNGTYVMTVTNKSTAQTFTATAQCAAGVTCNRQSAEWVTERTGHYSSNTGTAPQYFPLANFSSSSSIYNDLASTGGALQPVSAYLNNPIEMTSGGTSGSGHYLAQSYSALAPNTVSTNNFVLKLTTGKQQFFSKWAAVQ